MRRVLVPLDGSALSAAVLDDARRLAGPQGELILMQLVPEEGGRHGADTSSPTQSTKAQSYLNALAVELRAQGMSSSTLVLPTRNIPLAIDEAANATWTDLIACAMYSEDAASHVLRGGIAWRVLAHSPVPVLLRPVPVQKPTFPAERRHILVPLDGSDLAETALPLALELADEWQALLSLVCVNHIPARGMKAADEEDRTTEIYLSTLAASLPRPARWRVVAGQTVGALLEVTAEEGVTDVVMASHGRSGLSRLVLGSVAYDLVCQVALPMIVIPASANNLQNRGFPQLRPERPDRATR